MCSDATLPPILTAARLSGLQNSTSGLNLNAAFWIRTVCGSSAIGVAFLSKDFHFRVSLSRPMTISSTSFDSKRNSTSASSMASFLSFFGRGANAIPSPHASYSIQFVGPRGILWPCHKAWLRCDSILSQTPRERFNCCANLEHGAFTVAASAPRAWSCPRPPARPRTRRPPASRRSSAGTG